MEAQKPKCLAMVLCDAAHQDPVSREFTLLGIIDRFSPKKLPAKAKFVVYCELTEFIGESHNGLRIVDATAALSDEHDEDPLFDVRFGFRSIDPLVKVQGIISLELESPRPGVYCCELYSQAEDSVIHTQRLVVDKPAEPPNE